MPLELEGLQLVAFTSMPPTDNAAAVWSRHFKLPYENFRTLAPQHTGASAEISGVVVELQVQPSRVDLIVAAPPSAFVPLGPPPALPDFPTTLAIVRASFETVCQEVVPIRAAVVVTAREPASSEADASAKVVQQVAWTAKPNMTDLSIQANVRKPSQVQPGMMINRLGRWGNANLMTFQVDATGVMPIIPAQKHVVGWYLDVNTHPATVIDPSLGPKVFDELVTETDAFLKGGYGYL